MVDVLVKERGELMYTKEQFYTAVENVMGKQWCDSMKEANSDKPSYWCLSVAQLYFIDKLDDTYFECDMEIIKWVANNIWTNGHSGLID
jgi:hypothetical protein